MLGGPIMKAPLRYDFASFSTEAQAVCFLLFVCTTSSGES